MNNLVHMHFVPDQRVNVYIVLLDIRAGLFLVYFVHCYTLVFQNST